jgi:lauroyl/myristoyl acyltransferase
LYFSRPGLLYGLSDLLAFLTYYIFGYRKKVVLDNLAIAFPEKTTAEKRKIAKQFYRNFLDTLVESVKMISASEAQVEKRFLPNEKMLELIWKYSRRGKIFKCMPCIISIEVNIGVSKVLGILCCTYIPISNIHWKNFRE